MSTRNIEFGFLRHGDRVDFNGGYLEPVESHQEIEKKLEAKTKTNDLYPQSFSQRDMGSFQLPTSHTMVLQSDKTKGELKDGKGWFLLRLVSFIFGIPLQFSDWYFIRRVPFDRSINEFRPRTSSTTMINIPQKIINHGLQKWASWDEEAKYRFTNLLTRHMFVPSYLILWERFSTEYMVADGCFKLAQVVWDDFSDRYKEAKNGKDLKEVNAKKLTFLMEYLGIQRNDELDEDVESIYDMRNNLFHEGVLNPQSHIPSSDHSEHTFQRGADEQSRQSALNNWRYLRRINHRFIFGLLEYSDENIGYLKSPWKGINSKII